MKERKLKELWLQCTDNCLGSIFVLIKNLDVIMFCHYGWSDISLAHWVYVERIQPSCNIDNMLKKWQHMYIYNIYLVTCLALYSL